MKRLFLQLTILFTALSSAMICLPGTAYAQKLDNTPLAICDVPPFCQELPICTYYDDCFRFDFYAPKDLGNGTSVIKHKITNYSESTFKQATFELPGNGASTPAAVSPINRFANRYNHNVVNKFNDSLIAFNAVNAGTFSYGGFEVYYYIVNNSDLNASSGRKIAVTAMAGRPWQMQRTGAIVVDIDNCLGSQPCPQPTASITGPDELCYFGDEQYFFTTNAIAGATYNWVATNATIIDGQGTNTIEVVADLEAGPGQVSVTVTNQCGTAANTITFEVIECGPINPLPVELIDFAGRTSPNGIVLDWKTAAEKNNDRFEIERSADGKNFERIGNMKGNGTTSAISSYQFTDKNALKGLNYYRLRQVDFNGSHEFSQIVKIYAEKGAASLGIQLIPNPCTDQNCSVMLQGVDTSKPITVEMRDLTGRLIFSQQVAPDQASFELPKTDAGKGIYILSAKNGQSYIYQKIILQ